MQRLSYWCVFGILISICLPKEVRSEASLFYRWGPWSSLSQSCSVTCGTGVRCRVRHCNDAFGFIQEDISKCVTLQDSFSTDKTCVKCVVSHHCPKVAGWSVWGAWSKCTSPETKGTTSKSSKKGCQKGMRSRYRSCNNPPPEPPPFGTTCPGSSQETAQCTYGCGVDPVLDPSNMIYKIQRQVEIDHRSGFSHFLTVQRRNNGVPVRMSCQTAAYKLAMNVTSERKGALKKLFLNKRPHVVWYRNNYRIHGTERSLTGQIRTKRNKNPFSSKNPLMNAEAHWMMLTEPSKSYLDGTDLVIPNVHEGDHGFYTCELRLGSYKWTTIFHSLVVVGLAYRAHAGGTFYLHSNLGYTHALGNAPVWVEPAQLVWQLNGQEYSRGLAVRQKRRIQEIAHLNHSHQGVWTCYLVVPPAGPPEETGSPQTRVHKVYLINEFHLIVTATANPVWHLVGYPPSSRGLRTTVVALTFTCLILLLILLFNTWAAHRWVTRTLSIDQKKAILQEMVDNQCRLMLVARKRAAMNKERLVPIILREHQRLERTSKFLNKKLEERQDALSNLQDKSDFESRKISRRKTREAGKSTKSSFKNFKISGKLSSLMSKKNADEDDDQTDEKSTWKKLVGKSSKKDDLNQEELNKEHHSSSSNADAKKVKPRSSRTSGSKSRPRHSRDVRSHRHRRVSANDSGSRPGLRGRRREIQPDAGQPIHNSPSTQRPVEGQESKVTQRSGIPESISSRKINK